MNTIAIFSHTIWAAMYRVSVLRYYQEISYMGCRESLGFPSLNMVSDLVRRLLRMVRRASSNF